MGRTAKIPGFVGQEARRALRNQLLVTAAIAAAAVLAPAVVPRYVLECLRGPYDTSLDEIAALQNAGDARHRFVRLTLDPAQVDERVYHISGGDDNKNDWYLFFHTRDGRFLIIKTDSAEMPAVAEGGITALSRWYSSDNDVKEMVIPAIRNIVKREPLPVMLDTAAYRLSFWIMLGICGGIVVVCAWQLTRDLAHADDPAKNRSLRQIGKIGPVDEIALAIDAEIHEGSARVDDLLITRSWLIRPTRYGTDYVYLGDLAWAYAHQPRKTDDGIGVSKCRGYALILYDLLGERTILALAGEKLEPLLQEMGRRIPWAAIGFDLELQARWQANPTMAFEEIARRKEAGGG